MKDLTTQENNSELIAALHSVGAELPMPFERDIFLLGTEVAGARFAPNIEHLYACLAEGDRVRLVREPDNPYDAYAIRIDIEDEAVLKRLPSGGLISEGVKVGYVPRDRNKVFARLMDAGKLLYGVVRDKECINGYYKIVVKIFIKD